MKTTCVTYTPIGVIRSCHAEAKATPIQPVYDDGRQVFPR